MVWTDTRRLIAVIFLLLLIALVVVAYVGSGKNGTLVRNSLVARALPESVFNWQPGNEPQGFNAETRLPPRWVEESFSFTKGDADGLAVVDAAIHAMHSQEFIGKPIRDDLKTTWRLISKRGYGYCADYSKVFNAMMLAAGLPVREWALGHGDFGSGHTFNEVWLDVKWVFVDAFNGMLIRDRDSDVLLSVLEFRQRLEDGRQETLEVVKLTDPTLFFQTREEGLKYYARSTDYFYLIWGNNVFSYEASPWVQGAAKIARPLERLVAILSGDYPQIRMLKTNTNDEAIAQIGSLRRLLLLALATEVFLGLYLLWLLLKKVAVYKRHPPEKSPRTL